MNSKKIIGNIVAVIIILIGVVLVGFVRNVTGMGSHIGVAGALIIYSPFVVSIFIARFLSKRIQGVGRESKDAKEADLFKKDELTPSKKPDDQALNKVLDVKEPEKSLKDKTVHLGNFSIEIPEGDEPIDGYVSIDHKTKYSIKLSNSGDRPCDAEVEVDGKQVGIWRIPARESVALERPVHDTGHFTFYRFDSTDAQKAGLVLDENLGLISVLFKPEKPPVYVHSDIKFSTKNFAGGTGLSGESEQKFRDVEPLEYDEAGFVQIHLRLRCEVDEPRPLTSASTPVAPPIQHMGLTKNQGGVMYTYKKKDDAYFLFKDDEPLLTPKGNPVRTLYEPLAKRLLVDLDAFGEDPSDPVSIVTFHYPMIDFYASLPREEIEHSIRIGLTKENDWTFNCPTAEPHAMMRWLSIFGRQSSRAPEGEEWLATLIPMQLCAVCVIGRALESVNVPFILGKVDLSEEYMEEFIKEIDIYYPYVGVDDLGLYFDNFIFYFHMDKNNPDI